MSANQTTEENALIDATLDEASIPVPNPPERGMFPLRAYRVRLAIARARSLEVDRERLRAEVSALRGAVIAMCDTYSANRAEKLKVKAYRSVANSTRVPFSEDAVAGELEQLQAREREVADVLEDVLDTISGPDYARSQPTPAQIAEWRKVLR